jgi:hypothetical protein
MVGPEISGPTLFSLGYVNSNFKKSFRLTADNLKNTVYR